MIPPSTTHHQRRHCAPIDQTKPLQEKHFCWLPITSTDSPLLLLRLFIYLLTPSPSKAMAFVQPAIPCPCPVIICCNSHLLQSSKRARDQISKLNNSSQQEQDSHKNSIPQMSNRWPESSLAHIDLLCSRKRSFMGILNEVQELDHHIHFPALFQSTAIPFCCCNWYQLFYPPIN